MNTEEKAKAYDKAVKEASIAYKDEDRHLRATLERVFPELKESEDERMRKEIIQTLKRYAKCVEDGHDAPSAKDFVIREVESQITWLEKQSERKPAWSEEDEKISQWIISDIEKLFSLDKKSPIISNIEIDWLKSIKERIGE